MLKRLRKSSSHVTLVLIGVTATALSGCGEDDMRRDVYRTREDCLADWGNRPQDCTPATEDQHRSRGYFYGPSYGYRSGTGSSWSSSTTRSGSRSIGSSSVSRGGFGSSSHSSSSS